MSRKRKGQRGHAHVAEHLRDPSKEREILLSEMHKDPSIQSLLEGMPEATERQVLEMALRLQEIIRGDAALLKNPEQSDLLNMMRADAEARDAATKAYEQDKMGFIEGVFDHSEKIKLTGEQAAEAKKRVANAMALARTHAKQNRALKRKKLEEDLRLAPKEEVYVTGHVEVIRQGPGLVPKIMPEEVRIGHVLFVLAPGRHTVPTQVAEILRQRQRSMEETQKREEMISVDRIDIDRNIAPKWNKDMYTRAESFPIGTGIAGG